MMKLLLKISDHLDHQVGRVSCKQKYNAAFFSEIVYANSMQTSLSELKYFLSFLYNKRRGVSLKLAVTCSANRTQVV